MIADVKTPRQLIEPIEHLVDHLQVTAVFGEPTRNGETTIIPVASVAMGVGFGTGQAADASSGGGGGGGGRAEPRGFITVTPTGARYEPIMNQSLIALAGIAMIAWNVFWVTRVIRAWLRRPTGPQSV